MIKVGIVEDSRRLREGYKTIVNRTPEFECVCDCGTVAEALKKMPKAEPDVILMDIQLPDATGIECTAKIKVLLPKTKIIVVTVYGDSERIFQALQAGACGYLLKRSRPVRIIAAIQEAHGGGVPMTPEVAQKVIGYFREQAEDAAEINRLTPREKEVLQLVMHGLPDKEIAERMGVTVAAVRFHLQHIYEKLHVHSRTEAALKFRNRHKLD